MTDSQGPNDAIEVGLIGDFMSFGEEDVAQLRDIAYRNGLNTHHFLNENARKAYAAIDESSGVNDSIAIWDIVRNATSQEFAELAAGKASEMTATAVERVVKIVSHARMAEFKRTAHCIMQVKDGDWVAMDRHLGKLNRISLEQQSATGCKKRISTKLSERKPRTPEQRAEDELIANGWLRRGHAGVLVAPAGVGKSVMSMQMAFAWACGKPVFGIAPMRPLKIALFQSEDDEYDMDDFIASMKRGFIDLCHWTKEDIAAAEENIAICEWNGSTGEEFVQYLHAAQEEELAETGKPFDLIIINPLLAFFGSDLVDQKSVSSFMRNVRSGIDSVIKNERYGCSIFFIHHTTKVPSSRQNPEFGKGAYSQYAMFGSSELNNYFRAILTLMEGKNGAFTLTASKRKKFGWPDDKMTLYHSPKESGLMFWLESGQNSAAPQNAADSASPEDNVRSLAEALKGQNLSATDAEIVALKSLRRTRGRAAYKKLMLDLENPSAEHYGLKLVKDPNSSNGKIIVDA